MTECEKILDYIERNGSITKMEAYERRITTTLAQRIAELKQRGHRIRSTLVRPANPQKSSYARYSLE